MAARHTHSRSTNGRHPGVKRQFENVVESVRDLGVETKRAAQDGMQQARSTMDSYVRKGQKRAQVMERSFEDRVREQPIKALLVASGIGLLCGLIFRRS